ncbi:MAG: WYL domain-containing protein, partial [Chloroflexi bacterium]|nr:WYL domain-containing protein [Chloroflexota bacterium]
VLAASGLIELEKQTLARAKPQSIPLLRLLGKVNFGRTGAEETTTALDLGAEWSKCYPGNSPASGWLKTEAGETLFSFTHSKSLGEKLTFDPWLLFRVLSVCHPLTSWQEFYSCQLSEGLVTLARRRKVTFEQVLSYLEAGIGQILSSEVSQNISQWYSKGTYFRARAVILLEAETQQALKQCRNDRRLRIYLESLISPRFAVVKAGELRRLQQMMGRRGLFLQVEENLLDAKVQGRGLILKLTRAQLQEIVVGLRYYREERSQQGYFTESLDEALNTVAQALSGREQREAQNLVARFERKEQVISQERQEEEAILEEKLYKQLEEALVTEAEVLIEYRTPGKEVQKRWVEPLELRKEGNYSYLTAYCHLRKEQRVFRLDRMRLLEKRLNG